MASDYDVVTKQVCGSCGVENKITKTYSNFGPANSERETANCFNCKNRIASEKCLTISAGPVDG